MKKIRSIKYIDLFVNTNNSSIDYIIDITQPPYFTHSFNFEDNLQNIVKIIYNKAINLGFNKIKSIDFSKTAALDYCKCNNYNFDYKNIIHNISKIPDNKINYNKIKYNYLILKSDSKKIIIDEYNSEILFLIKELSNLDLEKIRLEFILNEQKVNCFIFPKNQGIKKVTDFDLKPNIILSLLKKRNNFNNYKSFLNLINNSSSVEFKIFDQIIFSITKSTLKQIIKSFISEIDNLNIVEKKEDEQIIKNSQSKRKIKKLYPLFR